MQNRIRMLWVMIGLAVITGPSVTLAYELGGGKGGWGPSRDRSLFWVPRPRRFNLTWTRIRMFVARNEV